MTLFVNNKPFSEMISWNNNMYFAQEFQPYVKLENVLDKVNLLAKENIIVSHWPVICNNKGIGSLSSDILEVDTTINEVKEEFPSEQIEDIALEGHVLSNVDLGVSSIDNIVIKCETEDNNLELYSIQEHSDLNLVDDTQCISNNLLENKVISTSLEENSDDLSSLDLHLSTDDGTDHEEIYSKIECPVDSSTQVSIANSREDFTLSLDNSSGCISETSIQHSPIVSPDMSQGPTFKRTSTRCPSSSSDQGDNREFQGVWNSQELSEVSQRLLLRTKQAKRLIMEVIRKRQMEEETLEAFKKRLRRM